MRVPRGEAAILTGVTSRRLLRARLATLLAAGLAAAALTGCTASGQAAMSDPSSSATPSPTRSASKPVIAAAIGDSIAIGNGVPAEDAWPLLVADHFGWTLSDFAESAAGFTAPGLNTHIFDDQVSAVLRVQPDVVLIGATRNDVFASTQGLKDAATAALKRLRVGLPHARIIGVGPLWGSDTPPAQIAVIDATVKQVVLDAGGSWVELGQPFTGHPELVLKDHVHPTVEGQKLIAKKIVDGISPQLFPR